VPCRWREFRGYKCDFTLLDRNGGQGFDLASKLLQQRDKLNRCPVCAVGVLWAQPL
jgi:hypothetical protein